VAGQHAIDGGSRDFFAEFCFISLVDFRDHQDLALPDFLEERFEQLGFLLQRHVLTMSAASVFFGPGSPDTIGAEFSLKAADAGLGPADGQPCSDQIEAKECWQKDGLCFSELMCIVGNSHRIFCGFGQIMTDMRFSGHEIHLWLRDGKEGILFS